jgi:hypothetical protein
MKYARQVPSHLAVPIRKDHFGRKGKFPPQIVILAMGKKNATRGQARSRWSWRVRAGHYPEGCVRLTALTYRLPLKMRLPTGATCLVNSLVLSPLIVILLPDCIPTALLTCALHSTSKLIKTHAFVFLEFLLMPKNWSS